MPARNMMRFITTKNKELSVDYGNTKVICPYCKKEIVITAEMKLMLSYWACPYCGNPLEVDT